MKPICRPWSGFVLAFVAFASLSQALGAGQGNKDGSTDPKVLQRLQKNWEAASASFAKHPKDSKARKDYIVAGVRFGHESMVSPILSAHVKYRQALHVYKQVLKVDPNNPVAKPEADLMIRIYKQLGRPIPD